MLKLFEAIKLLLKQPKTWVVIAALFGTNGMQAYINVPTKSTTSTVGIVKKETSIKIITVGCDGKVTEHVVEHHGGV